MSGNKAMLRMNHCSGSEESKRHVIRGEQDLL